MLSNVPSDCFQTAIAFPLLSIATSGLSAAPEPVSMRVAVPQLPDPTSYRLAQMLRATPWSSHCLHTAIAFPLPFTDRPGPWASWVEESSRVAVPQPDPTTYRFAQMCLELL